MKQRKTASIIFAAGMLLLAGCQKDDLQGRGERMILNLEAFGSGSKTVLGDDDRSLQWLSGDQVRINGVDYTVSTSVSWPSNSFFVFWSDTMASGTSAP